MSTYTVKQTISLSSIQDLFKAHGRGDNFSYEGLQAIMEYLEETSENGVIDLDVIGICCSFSEVDIEEALNICGLDEECGIEEVQQLTWAQFTRSGLVLMYNI